MAPEPFDRPPLLTAAEWRVLDELRSGVTPIDAAARLNIPEKRLRLHMANAAEKLRIAAKL